MEPRKERKKIVQFKKWISYSAKHNYYIQVTQNIAASLDKPGINGCWLEGEWTELGGSCSDAEEIQLRLVDWTPSPIPD